VGDMKMEEEPVAKQEEPVVNQEEPVASPEEPVAKQEEPVISMDEKAVEAEGMMGEETEKMEEAEEAEVPEFTLIKKDPEEQQTSFEFELNPKTQKSPLADPPSSEPANNVSAGTEENTEGRPFYSASRTTSSSLSSSESENNTELDPLHSKDRINRLKELSYKSKTHNGVSDMEDEPAYRRKNIDLDNVPHSSESQVSRLTLSDSDDGENKVELKPDNPFLHDNVD